MAEKKWTIFNVPYGGGYGPLNLAKPKGTRRAPKALQKEFSRQSIFIADNGVSSWRDVSWINLLVRPWFQNSVDGWNSMDEEIRDRVFDTYHDSLFRGDYVPKFLFLGGSHSITAATYAAIAQMNGRKNTGLILLDAHPDCCNKSNWPIHSDWLKWLVARNEVLPENILIIGLRQIEKEEEEFLRKHNVRYQRLNDGRDIDNFRFQNVSTMHFFEKLNALKAIYLSIDIDVVSGVFAPGTGCPSPGGFTDTEIINLVKQLKVALPNLIAFDIVEIDPLNWWRKRVLRYDATVDLGVKLIKEIIS